MPDDNDYVPSSAPDLAIRVGITGARQLNGPADQVQLQWARIRRSVHEFLTFVQTEVSRLATEDSVRLAYASETGVVVPRFRFLSALADGSDRVAAQVAVDCGYSLMVPMPFECSEYQATFLADPQTSEDFAGIMASANDQCLELDGKRDDPSGFTSFEGRSFEAVGRFVARNSDILIAVWDGKSRAGRGGTSDTLRFAMEIGVPVWWIHPDEAISPLWLTELAEPSAEPGLPMPTALVARYLRDIVVPPAESDGEPSGSLFERVIEAVDRKNEPGHLELRKEPKPGESCLWRSYDIFIKLVTVGQRIERLCEFLTYRRNATDVAKTSIHYETQNATDLPEPRLSVGQDTRQYWNDRLNAPDKLSNAFAARYRSVYVLIFVLTALSLICAATPLLLGAPASEAPHGKSAWEWLEESVELAVMLFEAAAIISIGGLIWVSSARSWHQRWIDYRIIAELFRKQSALGPLGWALPGRSIAGLMAAPGEPELPVPHHQPRCRLTKLFRRQADEGRSSRPHEAADEAAWVGWLYAAVARAAPFPTGRFDATSLAQIRDAALKTLIDSQIDYHKSRRARFEAAESLLVRAGEICFLAIGLMAVCKLVTHLQGQHPPRLVEFGAIVLPTLAAASLGIRHYAEMLLLVRQSDHMVRVMTRAKQRLQDLDLTKPLASQELGAITLGVSTEMLKDVDGWTRLFRAKVLEAG